jgi:hypothetical protein
MWTLIDKGVFTLPELQVQIARYAAMHAAGSRVPTDPEVVHQLRIMAGQKP